MNNVRAMQGGARKRQPTDHVLTYSGAGSVRIPDSGRFVRIIEATDAVYIKLDDISTELKRAVKSQISSEGFESVIVRSEVAQTIRLCISDEPQDEGRDAVSVSVTASVTPGNTFAGISDVALVAVTATEILPADAERLTALIKNPSSNAASVRIGTTGSTGAAQGFELEPGESIIIATTAAIVGYSVPGESVSVSVVRDV